MTGTRDKRLGIVHAYPTRYLLDSLATDGWRVVLIGSGAALANHDCVEACVQVPLWDEAALLDAVQAFHRVRPFDALLPVYEGGVALTAALNERLGLPGLRPVSAHASRNKYLAYQLWSAAGVPAPRTIALPSPLHDWPDVVACLGGRAVIKLVDSMNSQGVTRVTCEEEYLAAVTRLLAMTEQAPDLDSDVDRNRFAYGRGDLKLIAQEFCAGAEVGVDLLVDEHEARVLGVFQKEPAFGPCFAEHMSVWPTDLSCEQEAELGELAVRAVRALGVERGAAHVEIRYGESGPRVLEAGLRPGGAYTVMAVERMHGINVYRALAAQLLDEPLPPLRQPEGAMLYGGVVYPRTGRLEQVHGSDVFERVPGLMDVQILNHPGDRVFALPESAQPHYCYYLLHGDSRASVVAEHQRIQAALALEIS